MPKIGLKYTGDDKAVLSRLAATNGVQYFEPVDAREVLATPDSQYEPDPESRKEIGRLYDPRMAVPASVARMMGRNASAAVQGEMQYPQLQGEDAELQTGISHEKYGRSQVVKAVPDAMTPTVGGPQSTVGRPLDISKVGEDGEGGARIAFTGNDDNGGERSGSPASEGMTRDEIKAALDAKGVQYEANARKDELAKLLDSQ